MKQLQKAVEQMDSSVTLARAKAADPVAALRVWRQGQQARRLALVAPEQERDSTMNGPRAFQLGKVRAELRWYLELLDLQLEVGTTAMVQLEPQVRLCEILHALMVELGGATVETNGYRDQLQQLTMRANVQERKRARSRASRKHLRVVG